MNHLALAFLAGAAVLVAQPVSATPPDVTTVEDQFFAVAAGKLFVLRTTTDNLGLHGNLHTETFLVEIEVDSRAETYWLVYRACREVLFDQERETSRDQVTFLNREDWHDPYAILADAGAVPASAFQDGDDQAIVTPDDVGSFTFSYDHGPVFSLSRDQIIDRMNGSLEILAGHIIDVPRIAPVNTRELFREAVVMDDDCEVNRLGGPRHFGAEVLQLLRAECGDVDGMDTRSLIFGLTPYVQL